MGVGEITAPTPAKPRKVGRSMKYLIALLIAALILAGCGGASTTSNGTDSSSATQTEAPIQTVAPVGNPGVGETLGWDSHLLTVLDVDFDANGVFDADPGFKYVAVEVAFEAITEVDYNEMFDFAISDSDGYSYEVGIWGKKEPRLGSGTIRSGQKARGWIVFEVQKNAVGLTLNYEQFMVGNYGVWDLGK
jgi:hypothetical protein